MGKADSMSAPDAVSLWNVILSPFAVAVANGLTGPAIDKPERLIREKTNTHIEEMRERDFPPAFPVAV